MNEQPSNVLVTDEGLRELPEWLTTPDEPEAIQQAAREQWRDVRAVFAFCFAATLLLLVGVSFVLWMVMR